MFSKCTRIPKCLLHRRSQLSTLTFTHPEALEWEHERELVVRAAGDPRPVMEYLVRCTVGEVEMMERHRKLASQVAAAKVCALFFVFLPIAQFQFLFLN